MRIVKVKDSPYEDLVKIYDFDTKHKIFAMHFTKDTCHEKNTGICAIDDFKNDLSKDYFEYCKKNSFNRCVRAYLGIKNNITIGSLPTIVLHKCGHYGFVDGQHRICTAIKTGLKLEILFHTNVEDSLCILCEDVGN